MPSVQSIQKKPVHDWLRATRVSFVPDSTTPVLRQFLDGLRCAFQRLGHTVQNTPAEGTDIILATAPFGKPLGWREALLFTTRMRFKLDHAPTIYTAVHVSPMVLEARLSHFADALAKDPPDPGDFDFPGLASNAAGVLLEQGRRGGPILALQRLVQAQAKSIRVLLVVGEDKPLAVYHFDLVGAYPRSDASEEEPFYDDVVLRMATAVSTVGVNQHVVVEEPVPVPLWRTLSTPVAMREASRQLSRRGFFTPMVRIGDLVSVPAVPEAVASQYSEGCFATWDPKLGALIATVTGSARPVDKGSISDDDLALIVGVRPDGLGALTRCVEGKRNDPPSTEAVEMMDIDMALPRLALGPEWGSPDKVPLIRSKLHGHRGIRAYDPDRVEFVPLRPAYYHYPVSCGTQAQGEAIKEAFARSVALKNPGDPRLLAFTVLPGHGVVIVEKWSPGKAPFELMWEYMDAGYLKIDNLIPQGPMHYFPGFDGRLVVGAT